MIKILIILLASYSCVNLSEGQIAGPAAKEVTEREREWFRSQVLVEALYSYPQENYDFFSEDNDAFVDASYDFTPIGSGTIVHRLYVLTAAHLFDAKEYVDQGVTYRTTTEDVRIMAGSLTKREPKRRYSVQKVRIHHGYQKGAHGDDIALLQLRFPLKIADNPDRLEVMQVGGDKEVEGWKCIMSGWGHPAFGQPSSEVLRWAKILVAMPYEEDLFFARAKNVRNEDELAVLMPQDSGSGLLCARDIDGKTTTLLVGVAMGRIAQAIQLKELKSGSLFTSVHGHLGWIKKEIYDLNVDLFERRSPRSNQGSLISKSVPDN